MNAITSLPPGMPISSGACLDEPATPTARRMSAAQIQQALEVLALLMMPRAKSAEARLKVSLEVHPEYGIDLTVWAGATPWGEAKCVHYSPREAGGTLKAISFSDALGAMDEVVSERLTFFAQVEADKQRAASYGEAGPVPAIAAE